MVRAAGRRFGHLERDQSAAHGGHRGEDQLTALPLRADVVICHQRCCRGELADAAQQFDIARLDAIVRRLHPIQTNLQNDIAACNVTTTVSASAPSTSPTTR